MVGRTSTADDLVKHKEPEGGFICETADRLVLQCAFVDNGESLHETATTQAKEAKEAKSTPADSKFRIRKWVKRTWGKTAGRLFLTELKQKKKGHSKQETKGSR